MTAPADLSLAEWMVLGVVAEGPTHGWPIVRALRADGPIGQVWTVARPVVYRALTTLTAQGLIEEAGDAPASRGPQRTMVRITRRGRTALQHWLATPVAHVRDVRGELLVKLALLTRAGLATSDLVDHQLAVLEPLTAAMTKRPDADGFARILACWRREQLAAVERFLRSPDVRT